MNSISINKQFPTTLLNKLIALFAGFVSLMQGVLYMIKSQNQKLNIPKFGLLRLAVSSLAVLSVLMISNVFTLDQAEAHHAFISMKWDDEYTGSEQDHHEKTLLLRNNSTNHTRFGGDVRMLREDLDAWSAQVKWYIDDVLQGQSELYQQATNLEIPSHFGTWKIDLPVPTGTNNSSGYQAYDSQDHGFEPNDAAINNLPPGSKAKVVLDLQLTRNHMNVGNHFDATLFIEHNTAATWNDNSKRVISTAASSAADKEATIKTHHTPTSELSFTSQFYDGTTDVDSNALTMLDSAVTVGSKTYQWGYTDTSGGWKWLVGNETTCDSAKCLDVLFQPGSNLTSKSGKVRAELEVKITNNNNVVETDTLVYAINVPTFSISSTHSGPINEAGTATFEITTYTNPGTDRIPIKIVPYNSLNTVGNIEYTGTYLNTGPGTSGTIRNVTLPAFTGNSPYTANFTVSTRGRDGVNTPQGKITVDLNHVTASGTSLNYAVDSDNDSASVLVNDDNKPTITIGNAPNINGGETAMFPLEASVAPYDALTIRYRPTNTGGSFLPAGVHNDNMQTSLVTFTPKPSDPTKSIGTLPVRTVSAQNATGSISVALEADLDTVDPKYNKGSGTGTVSLTGCLNVALSLRDDTDEVTEGGSKNIRITADNNPNCPVKFRYSVSHTSGTNFLPSSEIVTNEVVTRTFDNTTVPGSWTASIAINTNAANSNDEAHGEFKVTLIAADSNDAEQRYTLDTSSNANWGFVDVTVYDSIKPLIKIGTVDPGTFHITVDSNNILEFREEIELTSDTQPHADLTVKFAVTETSTNTNFLKTPAPTQDTITFAPANPPRTPQVIVGKIDAIKFVDVVGKENATIMLTLQDDANNYTLGTGAEKTKSITIPDPSYFDVNSFGFNQSSYPGADFVREPDDNGTREVVLYIRDSSSNYEVTAATRVLEHEINNMLTYDASWFFNNSTTAEGTSNTLTNVSDGTVTTDIGRWNIPAGGWGGGNPHKVKWNSKFLISSTEIANIPLDSRARIRLNLRVPDGVEEHSTLHLVHNTATYWNGDKSALLTEKSGDSGIGSNKEGKIKTYHSTLTDLSFKSKLYDGSATVDEQDLDANQAGDEWSYDTAYGKWVVGTQTTCETATTKIVAATCFDVRFEPSNNGAELQAISNKSVKLDLEVNVGSVETDTLSYIVNGYDTTLGLTAPDTNQIFALTRAIDDVNGTATIHKKTSDTISIATSETTNNQGGVPTNGMTSANTNMDGGFLSKEYGHNLAYGSWYVEEGADVDTVADTVDSGFHTYSPQFVFKPDIDAIIALPTQSIRTSTLTITTMSGSDSITTESITITITRLDIPILSIEAISETINEGDTLMYRITANERPTNPRITINVTPTDTEAAHIDSNVISGSGVSRPIDLEFTNPSGTWTSQTFSVALKTDDGVDTGRGAVTVLMDPITLNLQSEYGIAASPDNSAVIRIRDTNRPTITIADATELNASYDSNNLTHAQFPITATTMPFGNSLIVDYIATDITSNFLRPAAENIRTGTVTFSLQNGISIGNLEVPTRNNLELDAKSGTFSVVLQPDDWGYELTAMEADKTGIVTVNDPSYVSVLFHEPGTPHHNVDTRSIYIKDTSVTYGNLEARTRSTLVEAKMITYGAEWFLNGTKVADSGTKDTDGEGTVTTPYGDWFLRNTGGFNTQGIHATRPSRFEPNSTAINSIPLGSEVSVELDLEVSHDISNTATINILHYTSPLWSINSTGILTESTDIGDFSVTKQATITSFHKKFSEFSFVSKLYDDSATASEFTLVQSEEIAEWSGMEWTAQTGYGQWFVGNPRICETDKRCYDVRFVPDENAINEISGKTVKNDLEVIITENGQVTETKTLTYSVVGSGVEFALEANESNVIRTPTGSSASSVDDSITGTVNIFKNATHTYSIEASQTTTNTADSYTVGAVDDNINTVGGFDSKTYGSDLTLGSWYVEERSGLTPTDYQADSNYHTITPKINFKPDATAIYELEEGEVRYSTLKIDIKGGSDSATASTFSSNTITVSIYRSDLPNFKISIVNNTINEGQHAEFTITADRNPGSSTTINYIPTNTIGDFLRVSDGASGSTRSTSVNFTAQNNNTWTAPLTVNMRNNNNTDDPHGKVTVLLNPSTTNYTTASAPDNTASVSITDLTTPTISIARAPSIVQGQLARFNLTSDVEPWGPLAIRFTPTETSSSFLDATNGDAGTTRVANPAVTFTPEGNSFVGTLLIPTKADVANTGTIIVQLEEDLNTTQRDYARHSTNNSAAVDIVVTPVPTLSIISNTNNQTEQVSIDDSGNRMATINESESVKITIKASENPIREFPISFTPTDTTGTYLKPDIENNGSGVMRVDRKMFREIDDPDNPGTNIWVAEIMIETNDDNGDDEPHGEIKVALDEIPGVNLVETDPANHVDITVNDSTKPLIKIGTPPDDIQRVFKPDGEFSIRPITITSDIEPHADLTIKYRRAEPGSNFISPEPMDDEEETQPISFSTSNSITSGTMLLDLIDDTDAATGMITITLLEDDVNYTLSTIDSEKVTQVTIDDPSYIDINSYGYDASAFPGGSLVIDPDDMLDDDGAAKEAFLYIRDPSTNYEVTNVTRALHDEYDKISVSASWYIDDSTAALGTSDTLTEVKEGTVTTDFGRWTLPDSWNTGNPHRVNRDSKFLISSEEIRNIPHGSDGRIELNLGVPNNVKDTSTLHIRHYTTALWNSNTDPVLTTDRNSAELNNRKEAKIRTHHATISDLSFESKLYAGVNTSEDANLSQMDVESSWSGDEWTASVVYKPGTPEENTFGRWVIGNETDCETDIKCLDVRFEPDANADIGSNLIKIELIITNSGAGTAETDTLTYFIDGNEITIPNKETENIINSPATPIVISNFARTIEILSRSSDTFNIVVQESTNDDNTSTTIGTISDTTNTDAGFTSKEYGSDLTLGKWYFDEDNTGMTVLNEVDSSYQRIMRKILFIPDSDGIANLPAGVTRKSKITINRVRKNQTVASDSFEITINRVNVPGLTITPPEGIIIEGDPNGINFVVTSDIAPPNSTLNVIHTVTQEQEETSGGLYLDSSTVGSGKSENLTFTQMGTVWIATLNIPLQSKDPINVKVSGGVQVELDESTNNSYFIAKSPRNKASVVVYDDNIPVISIDKIEPIFNTQNAVVTLTSNIPVPLSENLVVHLKATNLGEGDFIKATTENLNTGTQNDPTGEAVRNIPFRSGSSTEISTLTVEIETKIGTPTSGAFTVEIVPDTNPVDYGVQVSRRLIEVEVYRQPTLTLSTEKLEVNEGELSELTFTVTSDFQPLNDNNPPTQTTERSFNYTVTETTESTRNLRKDFLADSVDTTNPIAATNTTFTKGDNGKDWSTTITIPLREKNAEDDGDSEVTVTLIPPSSYVQPTTPTAIIVTIKEDSDPILSIADADLTFNGDNAEFTITSHLEPSDGFAFKVKLTNMGGNFLKTTDEQRQPLGDSGADRTITTAAGDFTQIDPTDPTSKFIYTLEVPTKIDPASSSGTIQVEFVADPLLAFNLSPVPPAPQPPTDPQTPTDTQTPADPPARNPNIASVTVYRTPTLSIKPKASPVNETEDLAFTITANYDPDPKLDPSTPRTLTINYTISEENGSFVDTTLATNTTLTVDELPFSQAQGSPDWTAELTITARKVVDKFLNVDGKVIVTLDVTTPDADYLAKADDTDFPNEASVGIVDKTIPVIAISGVREAKAGEDAEIIISSVTEVVDSEAFDLKIMPMNVIGNFLATTDSLDQPLGNSGEVRTISGVTLTTPSGSNFTGIVKIPTINDKTTTSEVTNDIITSGTIMVTLVADDSAEIKYTISEIEGEDTGTVGVLSSDFEFTLSISDVSAAEGDGGGMTRFDFEVTLSHPLEYPITVNYAFSEYEGTEIPATVDADFAFASDERSLEFLAGETEKEITVNVVADDTIELTEAFSISLTIMGNSRIDDTDSGIGTITTDDEPEKPYINVANVEDSVMEGQPAVFNISVRHPPDDERVAVTVDILVEDGGSFIAWRTPRTVNLAADDDSVEVSIPTLDDSTDEDPASITLTILDNDDYTIDQANMSDSVEIMDNDNPGDTDTEDRISIAETAVSAILSRLDELLGSSNPLESTAPVVPIVSVVAITPEISEGEQAVFEIISDLTSEEDLSISFETNQNGDFLTSNVPTQAQIQANSTRVRVVIDTQDDDLAEADGTITLQLQHGNSYTISTQSSVTVAVSDAADRLARKNEIASRTSEILPEVFNLVGSNTLATTAQRIQQAQNNSGSNIAYNINGAKGIQQIITKSGEMINSEPESLRSILGNSSFAFDVHSENHLTNPVTVWGLGELKEVSSSGSSASGWQGDALSGHFGFDSKLNPNTLLGMTTSIIDMDAGYALNRSNEFIFQSRANVVNPYLSWTSPNKDTQLQTIVGYGLGEIDIKQPNYQYETLQSNSSTISFNGSKRLFSTDSFLTGGTSTLNLVGESWITRLQVEEKQDIIDAVNLSAQHHRVSIDAIHNINLANGTSITPKLSVGALHDSKDERVLRGVELRSGLTYSTPIGLSLAGLTRTIIKEATQENLWSVHGSLDFDYGQDQLGPIINVTGNYSQIPSDYSDILNMSIIEGAGSSSMDQLINTEFQYGLSLCNDSCKVTPYAGYNFDVDGLDNSRVGARLSVGSFVNLDVEQSHNPNSEVTTNQQIQLRSRLSW